MDVRGKRVLVVGLARSGLAVARCLSDRGALVTVSDVRHPSAFSNEIRDLMNRKIGLELGGHHESTFLKQDLIVLSPGIPADLPALQRPRKRGANIVPEVEVAGWFLPGRLVGITGTNGKTTTTALAGKVLETAGLDPFVGGNIGVPLISALERKPPYPVLVAELSSFQLETIHSLRPHVAVLLNLTPNHLDRHPSFETYIAAKARIFENQTPQDFAVLNADDANVMKLAPSIGSRKIFFSRRRELAEGLFISGGRIRYRVHHLERALLDVSDVRLHGGFNLENVLAACAVGCVLGADFAALRLAVRDFRGVEHRLEFVREVAGVSFYNDSKATSVDAASKALATFGRGVHLILGGKDKGAPYLPLRPLLKDRVREILTIGAAAGKIERELAGATELVSAGTLEAAVRKAFERAEPGDTILLSPACSSFDQFENFEQRGAAFKELAAQLAAESALARSIAAHKEAAAPVSGVNAGSEAVPSGGLFEQQAPAAELSPPGASGDPAEPAEISEEDASLPAEQPESLPRANVVRELEYVYEVSAEEVFGEADAGEFVESEAPSIGPVEEALPLESESEDAEALAYEVRAAGAPQSRARKSSGNGGRQEN